MVEVGWHGETLVLLKERAVWWPRRKTICVADVHLGKAAAFRSGGIPVPETGTSSDLERLTHLVHRHGATRLAILGDLLHARSGRVDVTMEAFGRWRGGHPGLDVLLVRGNHDRSAGDPPVEWGVRIVDEPHGDPDDGNLVLAHDPAASESDGIGEVGMLCGHIHPAVTMFGAARTLRAKCFWVRPRIAVLPAFGSFTGGKAIRPTRGDRIFAVGEGVHEVRAIPGGQVRA